MRMTTTDFESRAVTEVSQAQFGADGPVPAIGLDPPLL